MTYKKAELKKSISRTARIFTFDMKHMPTEDSLAELTEGLKHWPDFKSISTDGISISVVLADKENKLGRLTTDDEAMARLTDLATKLLIPGGMEEV